MFPFVYEINSAGWFHLVYFGVVLPVVAVSQARKFAQAQRPLPNRVHHFRRTALTLALFGGLSLFIARFEWIELFPRTIPSWRAIGAGLLVYVIAVVCMRPRWRKAVERRARVVYLFMPSNATERLWWIVVAVLAGISEEITWRGVQAGLAYRLIGSVSLGAILCAHLIRLRPYHPGVEGCLRNIVICARVSLAGVVEWLALRRDGRAHPL
jgi:membrane protease YdiL (CAAX protease family)